MIHHSYACKQGGLRLHAPCPHAPHSFLQSDAVMRLNLLAGVAAARVLKLLFASCKPPPEAEAASHCAWYSG